MGIDKATIIVYSVIYNTESGCRIPLKQRGMKMTTTLIRPSIQEKSIPGRKTSGKIEVFHCFNALTSVLPEFEGYEIKDRKMPCSGMTREVFLLRAFEAGAEAVIVLVCPEGSCDYLQGNIRAQKRVQRVKKILDEIGIGGQRLNIYNLPRQDKTSAEKIIRQTISTLKQKPEIQGV
jgi:F420-non-reducing hydrogenase iron-sulfur subunit